MTHFLNLVLSTRGEYVGPRRATALFLDGDKDAALLLEELVRLSNQYGPTVLRADTAMRKQLMMTRRELENARLELARRGFVGTDLRQKGQDGNDRWGMMRYHVHLETIEAAYAAFLAQPARMSDVTRDNPGRVSEVTRVDSERVPDVTRVDPERVPEVTCDPPETPERVSDVTREGPKTPERVSEVTTEDNTLSKSNISIPNGIESAGEPALPVTEPKPEPVTESPAKRARASKPASPSVPAKPGPYQLAQALAEVTGMDLGANKGRLLAAAKLLGNASVPATPELVRERYALGGWFHSASGDWRAWSKGMNRTMQRPSLAAIQETWGRWAAQPVVAPPVNGEESNGNGTNSTPSSEAQRILQMQREWAAKGQGRQRTGAPHSVSGVPASAPRAS